jgi:uncharacterized protein YndB with AHSA1/START domain
MKTEHKTKITVETTVRVPVDRAWKFWTEPEHITRWNQASDDWHSPWAENDLRPGGKFDFRMEAKDGSAGFDFSGVYDEVRSNEKIAYTMDDGRKAKVTFTKHGPDTAIAEVFEAESENSVEMQRRGWQSILDHFKKYAEEQAWQK